MRKLNEMEDLNEDHHSQSSELEDLKAKNLVKNLKTPLGLVRRNRKK